MNLITEMIRLGIEPTLGIGTVAIDLGAWFPYTDGRRLMIDWSLSTQPKECGEIIDLYDESVINNRYPNGQWYTLSQKFGRKRCRTGCIIQRTHEQLAEFRWINISCAFKDQVVRMSIPIVINTSNETSCIGIQIHLELLNLKEPDMEITMMNKNQLVIYCYSHWKKERVIPLTVANDKEDIEQSGFIVFNETIQTIANSPENIHL